MRMRLTSLVLVLLIVGGLSAEMPLHSNEQECSMPDMAGMDCCKKAVQAETVTTESSVARLCCALNCSQSGTTGSAGTQIPRPSAVQALPLHRSLAQGPVIALLLSAHSSWADSPPPY